jgi:hypothetical protein
MAKSKLEQVLEHLVSGDEAKAKDLLHQVFIEKARAIHEELMSAEEMDEEMLGGDEGKQLRHDMMHHSNEIEELSNEIESEEIMGEAEGDEMDMDDAESDLSTAMAPAADMAGDDYDDESSQELISDVENTMGDLQSAIEDLRAEFEAIENRLEGGSDDADMDDMGDMGGEEMSDEEGEEEGEEEMDEMFTEEDFDDLAEAVELEKVTVPHSGEVGAGKFSPRDANEKAKSPLPPTQTSRFGAEPIKTGKGPKADGFALQAAPKSDKLPILPKTNQRKTDTEGMENEQSGKYGAKEDSKSALDTTDKTFGKGNQTSPLTHAPRK